LIVSAPPALQRDRGHQRSKRRLPPVEIMQAFPTSTWWFATSSSYATFRLVAGRLVTSPVITTVDSVMPVMISGFCDIGSLAAAVVLGGRTSMTKIRCGSRSILRTAVSARSADVTAPT
jgi:hypothetical protein